MAKQVWECTLCHMTYESAERAVRCEKEHVVVDKNTKVKALSYTRIKGSKLQPVLYPDKIRVYFDRISAATYVLEGWGD